MDILGYTTKKNGGTSWVVDWNLPSYVSVYQFDTFIKPNLKIDHMT